ncbi:MAG: hypothetical protein S4CHLAM45_05050 [Chlamydiales bacterium]|nr:hypothetical protein [Chlamydiales bacterium]MCH9619954.1 hypothetical protein [Chlamydiales bacterium]MCH9622619.1 hypothetical protein [Chlamydiales bacterium]
MRITISPQQRSYFQKNTLIEFEQVASVESLEKLKKKLSCSSPSLLTYVRKHQLAQIAFELTGQKPLRIANTFIGNEPPLNEQECALFLSLETGNAIYTSKSLYRGEEESYLILVFTSRYLNDQSHPTVYRYD